MRLIQTYSVSDYQEVEVFQCDCGRTHSVYSGGEVAFCPCEFEEE